MSCANNDINISLKDVTKQSLGYIYKYTNNDKFKPTDDINNPFSDKFKTTYSNNIQTDLISDNKLFISIINLFSSFLSKSHFIKLL